LTQEAEARRWYYVYFRVLTLAPISVTTSFRSARRGCWKWWKKGPRWLLRTNFEDLIAERRRGQGTEHPQETRTRNPLRRKRRAMITVLKIDRLMWRHEGGLTICRETLLPDWSYAPRRRYATRAICECRDKRSRANPEAIWARWEKQPWCDRRVSPSEKSAITCAVVSEAERHGKARAIQRTEQSVGNNCAENLVRRTSRTLYSRRFRVIKSPIKYLFLLPSRLADDVNSTIEGEFLLGYAIPPTTLILRGIELMSRVPFRACTKLQPSITAYYCMFVMTCWVGWLSA